MNDLLVDARPERGIYNVFRYILPVPCDNLLLLALFLYIRVIGVEDNKDNKGIYI